MAQRILELREEGRDLNKMAVLYRSHFHALELQLELTRRNIPFSITSGIRFFEQAHIKDVAAYLKFITNPRDELALQTHGPPAAGVGGKSGRQNLERLQRRPPPAPPLAAALQKVSLRRSPRKPRWIGRNSPRPSPNWRSRKPGAAPPRMIQLVLEAGYEDYLQEEYANYRSRLEDLEQLAAIRLQFESVEEFLTQLALQTSSKPRTPCRPA